MQFGAVPDCVAVGPGATVAGLKVVVTVVVDVTGPLGSPCRWLPASASVPSGDGAREYVPPGELRRPSASFVEGGFLVAEFNSPNANILARSGIVTHPHDFSVPHEELLCGDVAPNACVERVARNLLTH